MRDPIHELVTDLRSRDFVIISVTPHPGGVVTNKPIDPMMKIVSPDGRDELVVIESHLLRDPFGMTEQIKMIVGSWGWPLF